MCVAAHACAHLHVCLLLSLEPAVFPRLPIAAQDARHVQGLLRRASDYLYLLLALKSKSLPMKHNNRDQGAHEASSFFERDFLWPTRKKTWWAFLQQCSAGTTW